MENKSLYTIGHGSRQADVFLALLCRFKIKYLIDVRSQPYSKFNPQYNQIVLKNFLKANGIKYVFMGDSLGGRPKDPTCYDNEGKVDYEKVKNKEFFKEGIDRLRIAHEKDIIAAIMCSESKPSECHRSKLIGRVMAYEGIILNHIDEKGKLKDQIQVINELNKGISEFDLFGNPNHINTTSRKAYM